MLTYRPRLKTTRIVLHDSHLPNDTSTVAAIMRAQGRTLGLLDVGYHYVIERDGEVVHCRPVNLMGSHTPAHNHDSIGVCLAGESAFEPRQWAALFDLCVYLENRFGPLRLEGHYEVQRYRNSKRPRCPCCDMDEVRQQMDMTTSAAHSSVPACR